MQGSCVFWLTFVEQQDKTVKHGTTKSPNVPYGLQIQINSQFQTWDAGVWPPCWWHADCYTSFHLYSYKNCIFLLWMKEFLEALCFNNDKPCYQEEAVRIRQLRGNMVKYEMLWGKTPIVLCNWNISGTKKYKAYWHIFIQYGGGVLECDKFIVSSLEKSIVKSQFHMLSNTWFSFVTQKIAGRTMKQFQEVHFLLANEDKSDPIHISKYFNKKILEQV
jgi:hypothetical protein